jgi:hypothetical protein
MKVTSRGVQPFDQLIVFIIRLRFIGSHHRRLMMNSRWISPSSTPSQKHPAFGGALKLGKKKLMNAWSARFISVVSAIPTTP